MFLKQINSKVLRKKYILWGILLGLLTIFIGFYVLNSNSETVQAGHEEDKIKVSNVAPSTGGHWQNDMVGFRSNTPNYITEEDCNLIAGNGDENNGNGNNYKLWAFRGDEGVEDKYKVKTSKEHEDVLERDPITGDAIRWAKRCFINGEHPRDYESRILSNNVQPQAVLNKTPHLVLGKDKSCNSQGCLGTPSGFQNTSIEIALWVPENQDSVTLRATDLSVNEPLFDDFERRTNGNIYIQFYIKDKNSQNKIFDNKDGNSVKQKIISLEDLEPIELRYLEENDYKHVKYDIIAKLESKDKEASIPTIERREESRTDPITEETINNGPSYYNQFRLQAIVSGSNDVFLSFTQTKENESNVQKANVLGIANRAQNTAPKGEGNGGGQNNQLMAMWEMTFDIATDSNDGCNLREKKYIGLYDHDFNTDDSSAGPWWGWQQDNFPPKVSIHSRDRNEPNQSFVEEKTLSFDGKLNGDNERSFINGNVELSTGSKKGTNVDRNQWEDIRFEFTGDKVYRLRFFNLMPTSWMQIRVPYNQINSLQPCKDRPLFKVNHSDISVGGYFGTINNIDACDNKDEVIKQNLKNKLALDKPGLYGHANRYHRTHSSVEYAARVYDKIYGFYSYGKEIDNEGNKDPPGYKDLTFANDSTVENKSFFENDYDHKYGGYSRLTRCMPYYWRGADNLKTAQLIEVIEDDTEIDLNRMRQSDNNNIELLYTKNSGNKTVDLVTGGGNNLNNLKATIYIEGDLNIRENIVNNTGSISWTKRNQIGYIFLIVKGNIYIDPTVTQIDAVLVAMPDYSSLESELTDDQLKDVTIRDGKIYTCYYKPPDTITKDREKAQNYREKCQEKLTINGALIAHELRLGRTAFEDEDGKNQIGEEINFLPEFLIGIPQLPPLDDWMHQTDSFSVLPANF